ncbi:MAG: TonB-dependent receptor [Candidatus Acidiferrales bacterium]
MMQQANTVEKICRRAAILAAVFAFSLWAAQTARLTGRVVDEDLVQVNSAHVILVQEGRTVGETFTDDSGYFEFDALAPGAAVISVRKPGYFELTGRAVTLNGGENDLTLTLTHETELKETVEVRSSAAQLDPMQTAHQDGLVQRDILDTPVPNSHDLTQSLPAIPQVVADNTGEIHFAGARAGETEILLDGFEIGDPATGTLDARVDVDSVRQVTVESGNSAAEYAHAGAGVLAIDTAVGDDRWRFGATNFFPGASVQQGLHLGNWFPRIQFSGPIKRGRAWFSEAISVQHTFTLVTDLPSGQNTMQQWAGDNLLRGQVNLTPRNVLQASLLYNRSNDSNFGLGPLSPVSTTRTQTAQRYFVSVKDQASVGRGLVEYGFAADTGDSSLTPQGTLPYIITPSTTAGNYFETLWQHARRFQLVGNVMSGSRHWHGTHDLSVGANADWINFSQRAARDEIDIERTDGTLADLATFVGGASPVVTNRQFGLYAQDMWKFSKWIVLSAGGRADWDARVEHSLFEPRIGANVLPFGDDRAKFTLTWGRFYQPFDLTVLAQGLDQQRVDTFYDATGTIALGTPAITQFLSPSDLQRPYFDTATAGWEQRFRGATLAGINLTERDGHHGFAYQDLTPGLTGATFELQNGRSDRYRASEIWIRHRFGEQAEIFLDYTRSSATSNQALDPTLVAPFYAAQAPGPLPWDAPNRVVSRGTTPIPLWGLFLSYFAEYHTGFPFSTVNIDQQLIGAPDRLRFPAYFNLNLGVEKHFHLFRREWSVRIAAINVSGRDNPTAVVNDVDAPNYGTFTGTQHVSFTARLRLVTKK